MSDACGANREQDTRVSAYAADAGPERASGPKETA